MRMVCAWDGCTEASLESSRYCGRHKCERCGGFGWLVGEPLCCGRCDGTGKRTKTARDVGGTVTPPADRLADLRQRFDEWARATEFSRTTTRPVDAGEQMALRDAHDLLVAALGPAGEHGKA